MTALRAFPKLRVTAPSGRGRARQRGSVLVATAGALLVSVTLLASADLGYLFYMKREMQKVADLSALAGAQRIDKRNCTAAIAAATGNANLNMSRYSMTLPMGQGPITCGRWDPVAASGTTTVASEMAPTESYGGAGVRTYFGTPKTGIDYNAVKVAFSQDVPMFFSFLGTRTVSVQAIAIRDAPLATFSVGSKISTINPAQTPLGAILRLVGANVGPSELLSYNGLAQVKVTPSGLLQALGIPVSADLGVGELNTLLAGRQVQLGTLLNAITTVGGQNALASANVVVANALQTALSVPSLMVQLGSTDAVGGLFAKVVAPGATVASALNAQVSALDLITAAVGVASSQRGVATALNVGSIAGITATAKLGIIEPPSIGIGGIGTKAYTAQVRLYAHVTTNGGGLASSLLTLLGTSIDLPIVVDVVSAFGTLTDMNCGASPPAATIGVDSSLLKACVGKVNESTLFSTREVCDTGLQDQTIAKVLNLNLLSGQVHSNALSTPTVPVTLSVGQTKSTGQNPLAIGDTVSSLMNQLLGLILAQPSSGGTGGSIAGMTPATAADVADKYLTKYSYNANLIATNMAADGVTWARPCLIGVLTCPMPDVWRNQVTPLLGTCDNTCKRNALIASLQTTATNGVIPGLLTGVGDLVSGLLGGTGSTTQQNLLQSLLKPVIELLKPTLNAVGTALSNVLLNVLGIDLGVTDVKLMSLSCSNARLVY